MEMAVKFKASYEKKPPFQKEKADGHKNGRPDKYTAEIHNRCFNPAAKVGIKSGIF